jgi:carbon monoxide dehydrogenase subunit G
MEFSGTFELEETTVEEVWLALSDPELVWNALPGCQFLARVEDDDPDFDALREEYEGREPELTMDEETIHGRAFEEGATYAALMEVSLGSVSPSFRTVGTVDEREEYRMVAAGEGESGNSSFEGSAEMELRSVEGGVAVDWQAEADVFGRIAQMGQRVVNPAANRVIKRFFDGIKDTIEDLAAEETGDQAAAEDDGGATAGVDEDGPDEDAEGENVDDESSGETSGEGGPDDDPVAADAADGVEESGGLLARVRRLLGLGG